MADVSISNNLTGLARAMVNNGWMSEADADGVWKRASQSGDSFVTELIRESVSRPTRLLSSPQPRSVSPTGLECHGSDSLPQGLLDAGWCRNGA